MIDTKTACDRKLPDRRSCPTPVFSRYTFIGGRRKKIRRECDKSTCIFVDIYSTRLLIVVLTLLVLSFVDAYLTLSLIEKGKVIEANPIMAFFLDLGVYPFSVIKYTLTAIALIILCVCKNVNITRIGLTVAIKVYLAVIIYEIYLYMI